MDQSENNFSTKIFYQGSLWVRLCTNVVEAVVEASRWKKSKAWIQKRKKRRERSLREPHDVQSSEPRGAE